MPLLRLCVSCGRSTSTGVRLVGDARFVAVQLAALGLPKDRAAKFVRSSGGVRKRLGVSLCRSCARSRGVAIGSNPAPTVEQPEGVIGSGT